MQGHQAAGVLCSSCAALATSAVEEDKDVKQNVCLEKLFQLTHLNQSIMRHPFRCRLELLLLWNGGGSALKVQGSGLW